MIMIHDFTFAAGCLCVAAFLMSRDESSRIDRSRSMAGPTEPEAVHELELPGPLGPGFAKDPTRAASYAALAAAGAFASGVLSG